MTTFIVYRRVSTKMQGESGLGLAGQDQATADYVKRNTGKIIATYCEIETGKNSARPELLKALAHAKRSGATVLVSKLDRLSRNAAFLLTLRDSGVPIVCADNPNLNQLAFGIMAVVAQDEASRISERTTTALAQAKARGTLLGSNRPGHWEGREQLRLEGARKGAKAAGKAVSRAAREAYSDLLPDVVRLRGEGKTLAEIAEHLDAKGHQTRRGKCWGAVQVMRLLQRAKASD